MHFYCYLCGDRTFDDNKQVVHHLKKEHKIKEKVHRIKCTVKNSKCENHFQTFRGLSNHVLSCLNTQKNNLQHSLNKNENGRAQMSEYRRSASFVFETNDQRSNTGVSNENNNTYVCENDDNDGANFEMKDDSFVLNSSTQSTPTASETPGEATTNFFAGLLQLNLNETTMTSIVQLAGRLLSKTYQFCSSSMKTHKDNPFEMLDCSMSLFIDGLNRFNTAYKRKQFVKNHQSYIEPQQFGIGTHFELKRDKTSGTLEQVHKQSTLSYVSPLEIIKKMFKMSHFRDEYFAYQSQKHTCVPNVYQDFCCGSNFKDIDLFKDHPNSLQLQIFIDGFEVASPLKTKTTLHSQTAVYLSILNMPKRFSHSMSNIHLICLVNENDLKKKETNYNNIWELVVRDLKILEWNGIDLDCGINLKGKLISKNCKSLFNVLRYINEEISLSIIGTLVNLTYDNLGGNYAYGLAKSFSAIYFCRMCLCTKEETQRLTVDLPEKYRNKSNYNEALHTINETNCNDLKETKGIAGYCVLNELKYFHILDNWTADLMHDLCEGTIPILLKKFFQLCIAKKIFTEDRLKQLVSSYDYGVLNRHFIPSDVKVDRTNLNQNASQTKCLLHHTPFIFESYRSNPILKDSWNCINLMLKIVRICYSNVITKNDNTVLKETISQYLEAFKTCFKEPFKPKGHLMTHYHEIIARSGPLVHMSTMKYEMKHKELTNTMKDNNNFKNVTKSIAEKIQMRNAFHDQYTDQIHHTMLRKFALYQQYSSLLNNFANIAEIQTTKNVQYNSDYYEKGLILKHDSEFFEIEHILKISSYFYFVCYKYDRVQFNELLVCLEIKKSSLCNPHIIKHSELGYKKTHEKKLLDDKIYILADSLEIK